MDNLKISIWCLLLCGIIIVIGSICYVVTFESGYIKEEIKDLNGGEVYFVKYNETGNVTHIPAFEIKHTPTESGNAILFFGIVGFIIIIIIMFVIMIKCW